jgi:hypothetical protein
MYTIPLTLFLGKTLSDYHHQFNNRAELLAKINQQFPALRLNGHKPQCQPTEKSRLCYHGSYTRKRVIDTEGQCHQVPLARVRCSACRQTWTVYPSIIIPHKHYDAYVIQNSLEAVLSLEMTYRSTVRQQHQLTSSGQPRPNSFVSPYTPWHWVMWLGRFPLPLVLLACGLTPPAYVVEDEKFVRQNCLQTYLLGLVDHRYEVIWWLDYLPTTDQTGIQNSLQTFLDEIWLAAGFHHRFKGATTDGWQAAHNAFRALNNQIELAQCLLHPYLKFRQVLHHWAKLTKAPASKVQLFRQLFYKVLFAPDEASFEERLTALSSYPEFSHPLLAGRLASLQRKQAALKAHFDNPALALTSNAIDRRFARLERKFSSMQQFRTEESGYWTLTAWAIVQNFRYYGAEAHHQGRSPVEVAGVELEGLPWLQFILIKIAQLHWLGTSGVVH